MSEPGWLVWQDLRAAPGTNLAVVLGLALLVAGPSAAWVAVDTAERALWGRAEATPLVVGPPGGALDLVLGAVYFQGTPSRTLPFSVREALPHAVPLHLGHHAGGVPVVGTELSYLEARGLTLASGRTPAVLGEVLAGASVAAARGLGPGDQLRSDLVGGASLLEGYPAVLTVTGVLAPSEGPDDQVLLTDLKTAWVLDGALHGHQALTPDAALDPEAEVLEASAALFLEPELTAETAARFHLHGEVGDQPVHAVLLFPDSAREHDQQLAALVLDPDVAVARPPVVVAELIARFVAIRDVVAQLWLGVAMATLLLLLSLVRLQSDARAEQWATLERLGASRAFLHGVRALGWLVRFGAAAVLVGLVAWLARLFTLSQVSV